VPEAVTSGVIQIAGLGVSSKPVPLSQVAIHLHPDDDVAIATSELPSRLEITGPWGPIRVTKLIHTGHKVALRAIASGDPVRRYGQIIGFATDDIVPGAHVHSHNLGVHKIEHAYDFGVDARPVELIPAGQRRTFQGYLRPDGRVGTRNYVVVISTVNCSATVTRRVADHFRGRIKEQYPNVDGVIPLIHKGGCGTRYGGLEV
jgi:altronate hydrolase